jgi:6,7-dimethyl-8-ribityllumazine synthase
MPATAPKAPPAAPSYRLAVICSQWHSEVVQRGNEAFLAELGRRGQAIERVDNFEVPSAFEAPFMAKCLADSGRYAAVVVFALIADSGMYRHDFLAQAVVNGLMQVQLSSGIPVIDCVLIPHQYHEHEEHRRFYAEHFVVKGKESAYAALRTLDNLQKIESLLGGG